MVRDAEQFRGLCKRDLPEAVSFHYRVEIVDAIEWPIDVDKGLQSRDPLPILRDL
jgi:hypothetical protein